jgi:hypothetical protein
MQNFLYAGLVYFAIVLSFLAIFMSSFAMWQIRKLKLLKKIFFAGKNGNDLEGVIIGLSEGLRRQEAESLLASEEINELSKRLSFTIQKIGFVRYSPFNDGGGSYGFSLALLNAFNSGIVITNMYGRQQSRIYTKELVSGKSQITLTKEEEQAINTAR